MSDLIDDPLPGQNMPEYTVSEISGEVKRTLEGNFGRVRVRGEVGRVFTITLTLWGARAVRARAQAPEQRAWPGRGQGEAHLGVPAAVNVTEPRT